LTPAPGFARSGYPGRLILDLYDPQATTATRFPMKTNSSTAFIDQLDYYSKLPFIKGHHSELAAEAGRPDLGSPGVLARPGGRRIWPSPATLYRTANQSGPLPPSLKLWNSTVGTGPRKSTGSRSKTSSRLEFISQKGNVIFLGTVGVGRKRT